MARRGCTAPMLVAVLMALMLTGVVDAQDTLTPNVPGMPSARALSWRGYLAKFVEITISGPKFVLDTISKMNPALRILAGSILTAMLSGLLIGFRFDRIPSDLGIGPQEIAQMSAEGALIYNIKVLFYFILKPFGGLLAVLACIQLLFAVVMGRLSIESPPEAGSVPVTPTTIRSQNANLLEFFVSESYIVQDHTAISPLASRCDLLNRYAPNHVTYGANSKTNCGWCKHSFTARLPGPGMTHCQPLVRKNITACTALNREGTDNNMFGAGTAFCGQCAAGKAGQEAPSLAKCDTIINDACNNKVGEEVCAYLNRKPCTEARETDKCGACLTGYHTTLDAAGDITTKSAESRYSSSTTPCYPRTDGTKRLGVSSVMGAMTTNKYCHVPLANPSMLNDNIPTFQHYICKGAVTTPITATTGPAVRSAFTSTTCEGRGGSWETCAPATCWGPKFIRWIDGQETSEQWLLAMDAADRGGVAAATDYTVLAASAATVTYTFTIAGTEPSWWADKATQLAALEAEVGETVTGTSQVTATATFADSTTTVTVQAGLVVASVKKVFETMGETATMQSLYNTAAAYNADLEAASVSAWQVTSVMGPEVKHLTITVTVTGVHAADNTPLDPADVEANFVQPYETQIEAAIAAEGFTGSAGAAAVATTTTSTVTVDGNVFTTEVTMPSTSTTGDVLLAKLQTLVGGFSNLGYMQRLVTAVASSGGDYVFTATNVEPASTNVVQMQAVATASDLATTAVMTAFDTAMVAAVSAANDGVVDIGITVKTESVGNNQLLTTILIGCRPGFGTCPQDQIKKGIQPFAMALADAMNLATAFANMDQEGNALVTAAMAASDLTATVEENALPWKAASSQERVHFYCPQSPLSDPSACYDSTMPLWPRGDVDKGDMMPCSPPFCWYKTTVLSSTHPQILKMKSRSGMQIAAATFDPVRDSFKGYCRGFGSLDPNKEEQFAACYFLGSRWYLCDDQTAGVNLPPEPIQMAKECLAMNRTDNNGRTTPRACGDCAPNSLLKSDKAVVGTAGPTAMSNCAVSTASDRKAQLSLAAGSTADDSIEADWHGVTVQEVFGSSGYMWDHFAIASAGNPAGQRFTMALGMSTFDWEFKPRAYPTREDAFPWWETVPVFGSYQTGTLTTAVPLVLGGQVDVSTEAACNVSNVRRAMDGSAKINVAFIPACRHPEIHITFPGGKTGIVVNRAGVFTDSKAKFTVDPTDPFAAKVSEYTYDTVLTPSTVAELDTATSPSDTGTSPSGTDTTPSGTGTSPSDTATSPSGTGTSPSGTGTSPPADAAAPSSTAYKPITVAEPRTRAYMGLDAGGRWRVTIPYRLPPAGDECSYSIKVSTTSEDSAHHRRYVIHHKPADGSTCPNRDPIKAAYG